MNDRHIDPTAEVAHDLASRTVGLLCAWCARMPILEELDREAAYRGVLLVPQRTESAPEFPFGHPLRLYRWRSLGQMQPFLDLDIRSKVFAYLRGQISRNQFEDWFAPVVMTVEESRNHAAVDLAYDVELALDEFSSGHWTETELAEMLRSLAVTYERRLNIPRDLEIGPQATTASSSLTVGAVGSSRSADIGLVAGSA